MWYREPLGRIEVLCGSMFSGKTEELIRRLHWWTRARRRVQAFKAALDTRYTRDARIVSHSGLSVAATAVRSTDDLLASIEERTEVVGIDEIQFFDPSVVDAAVRLANRGRLVVVAGLDQDWRGAPFEVVARLMALAEDVFKLRAVCAQCGAPAMHSQRLEPDDARIAVGGADQYEPRCRRCFEPRRAQQLDLQFMDVLPVASPASTEREEDEPCTT